jgi:N-acetylglucosaminyldiphosphoundecaprenol N-acetyl-beta-D-mannosaminyltransferase
MIVEPALAVRPRFQIGTLPVDPCTFGEALARIEALVQSRLGGAVFTPNVDHVVIAESNAPLRAAYQRASLSLADGMPLVWAAPLLGGTLPERVAGSDLFIPLMQLAARRRWRVYLLGAPEVAEAAANRLKREYGVTIVGWHSPLIAADGSDITGGSVERARAAKPDLVVVGLGSPKQELWITLAGDALGPAVSIGLGAVLEFLVGRQRRAPRWIAVAGFEWLHRLALEPRRLWRRYLVQDPRFALIVLNGWWGARRSAANRRPPAAESGA